MPPKTAPGETVSTVTTKIVRRLLQIQQDMDYAGNCVNHMTGVLTDLNNLGTGTPGTGTPNDLGSMDVREFFTPVGGATYTVDGVTTPKYTGLTFTIQGELEAGYVGKFTGVGVHFVRYSHNTSTAKGHWDVLYQGMAQNGQDPVVQFKQDDQFLTTKVPGPFNLDAMGMGAVSPYLGGTIDGTKQETRFVLQGTLLKCQIIEESTQKAIRAAGEVDTLNMYQLLYADAWIYGADVARSRWTLGYVKGPLGPDGTIFDRS